MNRSPLTKLLMILCAGLRCLTMDVSAAETTTSRSLTFESTSADVPSAPQAISLIGRDARFQLQVTLRDATRVHDVTRQVAFRVTPETVARVDEKGYVTPRSNGQAKVSATLSDGELVAQLSISVSAFDESIPVNFSNQVVPIFTKFGCNGGGCHGKAAGQAGFKLSLLGFEPREDYKHLVDESRGRRLFPASPSQSLLLQKATGASPHGGGARLNADSHEYRLIERWIAGGMPYGSDDDPTVSRIEVIPNQRTLQREQLQQLRVVAYYTDGHSEDITRAAQYESNNDDLASVDELGLVALGQQAGDVAVMARFQGSVSVFRASIPLGAEVAELPESKNFIDDLVFGKLQRLGLPPSPLCDDSTFIRRLTLDVAGRLPTIEEVESFVASQDTNKVEQTLERLLSSTDHAEFFAKKWSSILRNRRANTGQQFGTFVFYDWLRNSFYHNQPYDQFVRELLTATGSVSTNPPVAWLHEVSNTESRVEDAAQLFLGQRLQCARCHHHPYEKWSQEDYFQMAAFFSTVTRKDSALPDEPRFVSRVGGASARHPKTGQQLQPAGLDGVTQPRSPARDPRLDLVDWMTAKENPFFARSLVNRYWKHFFATGLVEPEDDLRVTNPASNPDLLDALAKHFIESGYDLKSLIHMICTSNSYRVSSDANDHNLGDNNCYSRYYPKRLQAEVLLDAIDAVTQTDSHFDGMPAQTRAVSLPDNSFPSYFLDVFGKPNSATACECERTAEATLAQSLHLLNSKEVQAKLSSDSGRAAAMTASSEPLDVLVQNLYLAALSRKPNETELDTALQFLAERPDRRREAFEDLVWTLINSKEFLFNH